MSVLSDFLAGVKSKAKKAASYIPNASSFTSGSTVTTPQMVKSGAKKAVEVIKQAELRGFTPEQVRTAKPTLKEGVKGLSRSVAEIPAGLGYLSSLIGTQTQAKIADTKVGGKLADIGAMISEYSVPKTPGEAKAMIGFDVATLPFMAAKTASAPALLSKANTPGKVSKIIKGMDLTVSDDIIRSIAKESDQAKVSSLLNIGIEDSNFRKSVTAGLSQRAVALEKELQAANAAPVLDFTRIGKIEQEIDDIPKMAKNVQKMNPDEVFDMGKWLEQRGINVTAINEQGLASGVLPGRIEIPKVAPKVNTPKFKSALEAMKDPEMKARWEKINEMQRRKKVTKTSNNLYHTTSAENIDSIIKNGLTTGNKARFEGVSSPNKISFSANEAGASYYGKSGDVMIRTKTSYKPTDLQADLLAGGEGTYTTGKNIPPEALEIKRNGKWEPLIPANKTKTLKGFIGGGKLPEDAPAAKVSAYIKEMIGKREKEAPGIVERAKDLYKTAKSKLVDFNAPIEDVLASSQKKFGYEVRPTYDYTNQVDRVLRSPTLAGNFIRETGMEQLIKDVPNIDYLDQYLIAKQSRRLEGMGFETGRNLAKDGELIAALGKEYEPFAKRVYAFSDKLLDYTVKSGLISDDLAKKLRVLYPEYVPMNRVMDELESAGEFGTKGVASLSSQSVVQKLKGSTREVKNPIASLLEKTVVAFEQGEKNKAAKLLAGYRDLPGNPFGLRELKASDTARNTISYLENGVKRRFETLPEIEQAAKALGVQRLNILGKIFAAPVRIAKLGITGINIPFVAANIARDQVLAFVTSKHGLKTSIANPTVFIESVYNALGHKELYKRMVKEGGAGTSFDIARNQAEASIIETRGLKGLIKGEGTAKSKIKYVADTPARLLRAVEDVVGRSEELTRLQQFAGTEKALIKAGRTPEDARILAAKAARENTANFARRGEWGQVLNSAFLYLNASIQGSRSFIRALEREPVKTSAKLATSVFLPVSIATAWNLNDPKRKEAYMDIQDYEKENNIIIVPENPVKDENGKWDVIKMPLPPGMGRLASVPRRFIEQSQGLDPVSFKKIAQDFIASVSPVTPEVKSIASTLTPQAIKPTIEATMNKSLFTGVPQVSKKLENLPNELQVKKDTSFTARLVAGYFDVSPIKVQEFVKGTFGSVGLQALNAIDNVFEKTGRIQPEEVGGQNILDAVFARFGKATGGRESNKLYEQIAEQNKVEAGIKFKAKEGVQERFDTIRELAKQGDYAKMQDITTAMTSEEYKTYKGMAKEWKSANMTKTRSLLDVNPREAVRFVRSLDQFEQKRLVENLTPEEYEIYSLGK